MMVSRDFNVKWSGRRTPEEDMHARERERGDITGGILMGWEQ